MRRTTAAVGSAIFFLLAPGVVGGLIPWLLTGGWQVREPLPYWVPLRRDPRFARRFFLSLFFLEPELGHNVHHLVPNHPVSVQYSFLPSCN